ncbi:MAG TPA: histidinol dehydrogenase, partial [Pyrinomonadaceae bacterium]|nr:histidinol dehydrogenase [Pyrinomonadaceae bacterium]
MICRVRKIEELMRRLAARSVVLDAELMKLVSSIIEDVRTRGDEALIDYAAQFDGVELKELRVSEEELRRSAEGVDERVLMALRQAIRNVRRFHQRQVEDSWTITPAAGVELGQRITPLDRVGLYVPGGT